jgi:hypothetical protein
MSRLHRKKEEKCYNTDQLWNVKREADFEMQTLLGNANSKPRHREFVQATYRTGKRPLTLYVLTILGALAEVLLNEPNQSMVVRVACIARIWTLYATRCVQGGLPFTNWALA